MINLLKIAFYHAIVYGLDAKCVTSMLDLNTIEC